MIVNPYHGVFFFILAPSSWQSEEFTFEMGAVLGDQGRVVMWAFATVAT
jgi:hypothetical protein